MYFPRQAMAPGRVATGVRARWLPLGWAAIGILLWSLVPRTEAQTPQPDGFNPGADGMVLSLAPQPDGGILVGGAFGVVAGQTRRGLTRLTPTGAADPGFDAGVGGGGNPSVYTMTVQPDGKIVLGGGFLAVGGTARGRIARLNPDGTLDGGFAVGSGADNYVLALARTSDGSVLIGGDFGAVGGQTHARLARFGPDGKLDPAFNPAANYRVHCLAVQPDGGIIVGGWFGQLTGLARGAIGRLWPDGSLDAGFNPEATGGPNQQGTAVHCLAVQPDGKIVVGGDFTRLAGQGRARIGRLNPDGTLDEGFTPRLHRRAYAEGYTKLVEHAPGLWGMLFDSLDNAARVRKLTRLRRALARLPAHRFVRELDRLEPRVVLATHFLPLEILGRMAATTRPWPRPFTATVVTDFEAHALWMEPVVDLYCVAAEETRARLLARGAAATDVAVTGIPVAAKFARPLDAAAVRKRHGLRDDLPVLLVLSGGFGLGPVEAILGALGKVASPLQIVVVCGRNEALRARVALCDRKHPMHVLGFVTDMQDWMAAADLIVTKPGGLTSSEALALGRPLLIVNPIPGQEAANSDFLLEHGAAVKVNRIDDLPAKVARLLGSDQLAKLAEAARALGRPQAAQEVCARVFARIEPHDAARAQAAAASLTPPLRRPAGRSPR
jgi:processive 1,2-diacylglycerol beta-glucosyltransferase